MFCLIPYLCHPELRPESETDAPLAAGCTSRTVLVALSMPPQAPEQCSPERSRSVAVPCGSLDAESCAARLTLPPVLQAADLRRAPQPTATGASVAVAPVV